MCFSVLDVAMVCCLCLCMRHPHMCGMVFVFIKASVFNQVGLKLYNEIHVCEECSPNFEHH